MRNACIVSLAVAWASCGNGGAAAPDAAAVPDAMVPDAFEVDPAVCVDEQAIRDNVFSPAGCTTTNCHDVTFPAEMLDLQRAGVEARLIGVAAQPPCETEILVVAGDAGASYFVDKLRPDPACGVQMPSGGRPLSDDQLNCVRNWIDGL